MRLFYCVCMLLMTCIQKAVAQPLKNGNLVPQVVMAQLYSSSTIAKHNSSFHGKLIILDFWDTRCLGCILAFPVMDSLQKAFGNQIKIIMVNRQDSTETADFFAKRKKIIVPDLPFITGDTLLNQLFPHAGEPFHVWIDQNGRVLYQVYHWNTNTKTIRKFLSNGSAGINNNSSTNKNIGYMIDTAYVKSMSYFSYLCKHIQGIHLRIIENDSLHIQLAYNCSSVLELYQYAYAENGKYDFNRPGRMDIQTKDNIQIIRPSSNDVRYADWFNHYSYNYHIYLPISKKNEIYDLMKEDLKRYFGLKAAVMKTPVKCLTLVRTGNTNKLATKGGEPKNTFLQSDVRSVQYDSVREIVNEPFSDLADRLQLLIEFNFKRPFFDETGYRGKVDFKMDGKEMDTITLESLRKTLRRYGLDLIEKTCVMPVLHISDH